jgi:hypothetical protein
MDGRMNALRFTRIMIILTAACLDTVVLVDWLSSWQDRVGNYVLYCIILK